MDQIKSFEDYERDALLAISNANAAGDLEAVRIEYLGKKQGRLKDLQAVLGTVPPDQRPTVGKRFNEIKDRVTAAWENKQLLLAKPKRSESWIDVTLPGTGSDLGRRHPLTQTIDEFKGIMARFGFDVEEGPEVEDEWHNFVALTCQYHRPR